MVIDELKAKAGFGGARVRIDLPRNEYRPDEIVKGDVLLTGGTVNQKIHSLTICLIREWNWECYGAVMDRGLHEAASVSVQTEYELDGDTGRDTVSTKQLGEDITIEPEEIKTFPFAIELSTVRREKGVSERWKLLARLEIPFARYAQCEREITLVTPGSKHT